MDNKILEKEIENKISELNLIIDKIDELTIEEEKQKDLLLTNSLKDIKTGKECLEILHFIDSQYTLHTRDFAQGVSKFIHNNKESQIIVFKFNEKYLCIKNELIDEISLSGSFASTTDKIRIKFKNVYNDCEVKLSSVFFFDDYESAALFCEVNGNE